MLKNQRAVSVYQSLNKGKLSLKREIKRRKKTYNHKIYLVINNVFLDETFKNSFGKIIGSLIDLVLEKVHCTYR